MEKHSIDKSMEEPPASAQNMPPNAADPAQDSQSDDIEHNAAEKPKGPPGGFNPRENPDGGAKAWLSVLGGFCSLFCSFGWINCIGVFQNYYQTHQLASYAPSTVAWIASLQLFFIFFFGPFIGKIFDSYGPRYLLLVGTFLEVFGLMMTSLSSKYYQFILAQGICSSIGASCVFYPAMSCVSTWFFHKRALAFGVMAAGSSVGGVIFPIMVQRLIVEVGFGWSMRITAFLVLGLLIIANLTIRSRINHKPTPFNAMEFVVPLKEVGFSLVCFGAFVFFLGLFLPFNFLILEAIKKGMSPNLAQYLVSILNATSFFGRVIPGYLADKVGRYNMMFLMCICSAIFTLALWLPASGNAPIIVFAAFFGFSSGAYVSLAPSLIAQISDVRKIGVRTGTLFAIISIAALICQPIGGALVTRWHGRYTGMIIYAGCMMVAGSFILLSARIKLAGPKLTTKF